MSTSDIELGFVEKRTHWKLLSKFFPSKVGGSPAWLRLNNLPDRSELSCKFCSKPLSFLLQVYAPIIETEDAFHRTIFIFICRNGACNKKNNNDNFLVLRNQLPRKNEFFSFHPPVVSEKLASEPSAEQYQPICSICGVRAVLKCTKCLKKDYCCDEHRECDWEWNHVHDCEASLTKDSSTRRRKAINHFLLPEYELVTETEEIPDEIPEKSDEEKMKEYMQFLQSSKLPKEFQEMPVGDLESVEKKKDKAFNKFKKRVQLEPEQVLRYQRGGEPLWVSSENIPTEQDIPDCQCGAKRIFEFQIMPQLLNYLSLDSIQDSVDWGTLIVFTCSSSCNNGTDSYIKEVLWKQDFSDESQFNL